MRRVLVICSVHRPLGNATAAQLHWLLGRLGPDVLFLEHASTDFSTFLDGSCGTLESAAVMHYRVLNAVELVPVGLHLPAAELKPKFDEMFDAIEDASPRYCQLVLANRQHTAMGGFAYLNGPDGVLLQPEIRREMWATVEAIGDPRLADLYALWTRTNDLREAAMINGVEAYASQLAFKKGVLLVGAAHRHPLFESSRLPRGDIPSAVTWDFDWELEQESLDGDARRDGSSMDRGALG